MTIVSTRNALLEAATDVVTSRAYAGEGITVLGLEDLRVDWDSGFVYDPTYESSQGEPRFDIPRAGT